jgi:hypothetical protein
MKNVVFWDVTPCGLEERIASIIKVTRMGELGITLAVTRNFARCEEIVCNIPEDGILQKVRVPSEVGEVCARE